MSKRFVVVGGATAVAGLVLGASIVLGPPAANSGDPDLPGDIDAPDVVGPDGTQPGVKINEFDYTTFEVDADGQLRGMRLRATRTNLKPLGITNLIKPNAEIRLGSQRAITITADEADMEMEDSKPRAGVFSGNVVVTLAQAPEGTDLILDPKDPAHKQFIQQRIYLDEATHFSIEEDTISTVGPVHVTSDQVDFFGLGLRLAYNTQRERIEQLIINEGRYLIVNPDADAAGFSEEVADPEQREASDTDPETIPGPAQFYAARFSENVIVRDGLESQLGGQTLTIDFSLGTEAVQVQPISPDANSTLPRFISTGQLVQAQPSTLPAITIPATNAKRSLFTHDPKRDVVVTWTGEMRVTPHAERPEQLADEDDAHLTLVGENAYAQTTRNGELERLETHRLEYLLSQQRTTAYAKDDTPVRILSDALGGQITGQQLTVRQSEGTATILGPGQINFTSAKDGKTLVLTWQNRLDFELYTTDTTPTLSDSEASGTRDSSLSQTKILGVKTATFDGKVTARHTDFDLDSDQLTIAFAKPDKQKKIDNHPTAINASGKVAVKARGDAEDETFDIAAQRLSIDLKLDRDNEPYASSIRALDDVLVKRPGSTLTCQRVSVELNPPSETTALANSDPKQREASGTPTDERFAQVRSILAVGKVRANLDYNDRRVDLVADQLIADVEKDRLTLASDNTKELAEITDLSSGRKLTGQLVVMDDQAEVLTITGPGTLATVLNDAGNPKAGIEDAFLAIAWEQSMSFNNITGQAEFKQGVRSESRRSTDASEMTCDQLSMVFSPDYKHDPQRLLEDDGKDEHERQIRSAIATGDVKFMAWAWDTQNPKKINNRVRLEGPKLLITNKPANEVGDIPVETIVVEGQGRMVLEDYRPPDEKQADDKASMTGRGATLFSWKDAMTLNALTNTATLVDTVKMTHIPKDETGKAGDPVQLDCNKLVADMTDTGGMSVWLSDQAPDAQVQTITATNNVRLLQQGTRSMRGDRMSFNAALNQVILNANANRDVIIEDLQRDAFTRTNKVTWDLTTDRIEIDKLRGGVAPLD